MNKETLRKEMLIKLKKLEPETRRQKTDRIISRLLADSVYQEAHSIGITLANFPEIDTLPIIQHAWESGKQISAPKCIPSSRKMDFYAFDRFDQLETVYMNLKEPNRDMTRYMPPDEIDLLIVPGMIFTRTGYRIGFGGGYYDRFLADFSHRTASLAFDCQIFANLPVEAHDIPVQMIYTDNQLIRTEAFR